MHLLLQQLEQNLEQMALILSQVQFFMAYIWIYIQKDPLLLDLLEDFHILQDYKFQEHLYPLLDHHPLLILL